MYQIEQAGPRAAKRASKRQESEGRSKEWVASCMGRAMVRLPQLSASRLLAPDTSHRNDLLDSTDYAADTNITASALSARLRPRFLGGNSMKRSFLALALLAAAAAGGCRACYPSAGCGDCCGAVGCGDCCDDCYGNQPCGGDCYGDQSCGCADCCSAPCNGCCDECRPNWCDNGQGYCPPVCGQGGCNLFPRYCGSCGCGNCGGGGCVCGDCCQAWGPGCCCGWSGEYDCSPYACCGGCGNCGGAGCPCCAAGPGCCCASGDHRYNFAPGPPTAQTAYPYYTVRGPRDFLQNNPQPLGPY